MVSDTYFALEKIPEKMKITDFREHKYEGIESLKPEDVSGLGKINARDFLMQLSGRYPDILNSLSSLQLVERLEKVVQDTDFVADGGMGKRDEVNLYCAVRDNTYQIIQFLKNA